MTECQETGDEAPTPWHRRRVVRWLVVLAVTGAVYGLAAVVWHVVMGKSWEDSWSFALTLTAASVGGQWMAAVILRKAGRGAG
ncbi:hypothetical protein AB0D14_15520 [Streptomyces sp. NPDC048484]|uniref:hypothetical protein n=1 Tax=Streptomyces sp. NPDC048484 TaxID=3155146 RepID=UPI003425DD8E